MQVLRLLLAPGTPGSASLTAVDLDADGDEPGRASALALASALDQAAGGGALRTVCFDLQVRCPSRCAVLRVLCSGAAARNQVVRDTTCGRAAGRAFLGDAMHSACAPLLSFPFFLAPRARLAEASWQRRLMLLLAVRLAGVDGVVRDGGWAAGGGGGGRCPRAW